jgi:hypothetical protein
MNEPKNEISEKEVRKKRSKETKNEGKGARTNKQ